MSIAADILAAGAVLGLLSPYALMATGRLHAGRSCSCPGTAPVAEAVPAAAWQLPVTPRPALADDTDMPRAEAARLLGITDREARGLAAAGVLEGLPYDGRPARVTTASVREFLAVRNGKAVTP